MKPPAEAQIAAPEFPKDLEWIHVAFLRMAKVIGRQAMLVEFFDAARINSVRALDYTREWHRRYGDRGLRVIGVHSPGYSFGADPEWARAQCERLEIEHAVVLDPDFLVWRQYGNRGWPARYLWGKGGALVDYHYGEGAYAEAEAAIQETIVAIKGEEEAGELPELMAPIRPEEAEGALMEAQTVEVRLPADRERLALEGEWVEGADFIEAATAGATASIEWTGGAAWAVLSGTGVERAGLHETDGRVEAPAAGFRLHGLQFTPAAPQS